MKHGHKFMIHSETFGFQRGAHFRLSFFFAVFRMKGYVAGFITVVLTVLVALFAYKMPFAMAMATTGYGFCTGYGQCLDYHYVHILYKISVKRSQFDVIRASYYHYERSIVYSLF